MDPYGYADQLVNKYQYYDPQREAMLQQMYQLAEQDPGYRENFNNAYMQYMYPQQDPLMSILGGGQQGAPMAARWQDPNAQKQTIDPMTGEPTIEVPDDTARATPIGQVDPVGGLLRGGLSWLLEPVALGGAISGQMSSGGDIGQNLQAGFDSWNKDFQQNNIFGNLAGQAVSGMGNIKKNPYLSFLNG